MSFNQRYLLLSLLFLFLAAGPTEAQHRQQSRERPPKKRVASEGSRGCPFPQGNLYLEENYSLRFLNQERLVVEPQAPIIISVTPAPDSRIKQQTVLVSLVDWQTKETAFYQEYTVTGEADLSVKLGFPLNRPYLLTANLLCNPQRPSTNKSLRVLLVPPDGH